MLTPDVKKQLKQALMAHRHAELLELVTTNNIPADYEVGPPIDDAVFLDVILHTNLSDPPESFYQCVEHFLSTTDKDTLFKLMRDRNLGLAIVVSDNLRLVKLFWEHGVPTVDSTRPEKTLAVLIRRSGFNRPPRDIPKRVAVIEFMLSQGFEWGSTIDNGAEFSFAWFVWCLAHGIAKGKTEHDLYLVRKFTDREYLPRMARRRLRLLDFYRQTTTIPMDDPDFFPVPLSLRKNLEDWMVIYSPKEASDAAPR